MTLENKLVNKTYFEKFVIEGETNHPIKVLAEAFLDQGEEPDSNHLSVIRFSQGEVYFHNKDYEAAIFKWESITDDELLPWAKKNMADSYYELKLLSKAEAIYTSIQSKSLTLNTEVALQLFSIYLSQERLEDCFKVIKNVVSINPGYPQVTEIARAFFEEYRDWDSAIELAVKEARRTEAIEWYDILRAYIDKGLAKTTLPEYFSKTLRTLFSINPTSFEKLVFSLWNSYKNEDFYFTWISTLDQLLHDIEMDQSLKWNELASLYEETYADLMNGSYYIHELAEILPSLLTNWLKVTTSSQSVLAASAVLSWEEAFPSSISTVVVNKAKARIKNVESPTSDLKQSLRLFNAVKNWAQNNELDIEKQNDIADSTKDRNEVPLSFIRQTIKHLFEKRVELEKKVNESVNWNEEMAAKLGGAIHQVDDMEREKVQLIKASYSNVIENIKNELANNIPKLFKECAESIKEDSDFSILEKELNNQMNERLNTYIQTALMPQISNSIQDWMNMANEEFNQSQLYLNSLAEGLNAVYAEERLMLECDFKILDDWIRDAQRMKIGIRLDTINVFEKLKASLFLLKSSNKLFGSIPKNKKLLYKMYKRLIENESYTEVVDHVTKQFVLQYEMFEKAIERDIIMFFRQPNSILKKELHEVNSTIETNKDSLKRIKSNPEVFFDPITLFEIRLRQLELQSGEKESLTKI